MESVATLTVQLTTGDGTIPIRDATVEIYRMDGTLVKTGITDISGKTIPIELSVEDKTQATYEPFTQELPYSEFTANVQAKGYIPIAVKGIQMYAGIPSILPLELYPYPKGRTTISETYEIPEPAILNPTNALRKEAIPSRANQRILQSVYIPSAITVHLGSPNNTSAENITVSFPEYIKNVASSEIYPTWPEQALRANIYAQISFALNRIFTEWYPSRGYNFNITNHTGYDQYYVKGRNIFENISQIVDDIFDEYVRKVGALNPLFTEYCNGSTVTCGGLSQWGTVPLAEQGYNPLQILRYYYGNKIEITQTDNIQDIISSYPGHVLKEGMTDPLIPTLKTQLNQVAKNYPLIPTLTNMNNTFDAATTNAVKTFQKIFNLTADGIVGKATWNKLSYLYVAILKLSELNGGMVTPTIPETPPTSILQVGSSGSLVKLAQYFLAVISQYYQTTPIKNLNGHFDDNMKKAVMDFQTSVKLDSDGIIGPKTWEALYNTFLGIGNTTGLVVTYPGTLLKQGSKNDQVWLMQSYLQKISEYFAIPTIQVDGIFGPKTKEAVIAFQKIFGLAPDGIIGRNTWNQIVAIRMLF